MLRNTLRSTYSVDILLGLAILASSTPTTMINGRAIVGALPWETFERLLSEAFVVSGAFVVTETLP